MKALGCPGRVPCLGGQCFPKPTARVPLEHVLDQSEVQAALWSRESHLCNDTALVSLHLMGLQEGPRPHDAQCPVSRPTFSQLASLEPARDLSGNRQLRGFGAWLLQGQSGGIYFMPERSHFYWFFPQDFRTAVASAAWSVLKQFA